MSDYTVIIILTFVGFTGLAALLLVPVYRFLKREERASKRWMRGNDVEAPLREASPSSNGAASRPDTG